MFTTAPFQTQWSILARLSVTLRDLSLTLVHICAYIRYSQFYCMILLNYTYCSLCEKLILVQHPLQLSSYFCTACMNRQNQHYYRILSHLASLLRAPQIWGPTWIIYGQQVKVTGLLTFNKVRHSGFDFSICPYTSYRSCHLIDGWFPSDNFKTIHRILVKLIQQTYEILF